MNGRKIYEPLIFFCAYLELAAKSQSSPRAWVSWGAGLGWWSGLSLRACQCQSCVSFDINHARMPSLDKDTSLARVRAQPALSLLALPPSAALVQPLSHPVGEPHRPLKRLLRQVQARRGSDVDLHLCGLWPTPLWSVAQVSVISAVCGSDGPPLRWHRRAPGEGRRSGVRLCT